jgi:hypothetical protein
MRTTGTFQTVYTTARNYTENENGEGCPMDPVVRREGGKWMIESAMEPTDGDFEVTLEEFDSYFYESYKSDFVPSESDIDDFIAAHANNEQ